MARAAGVPASSRTVGLQLGLHLGDRHRHVDRAEGAGDPAALGDVLVALGRVSGAAP